jgi:hypothetical protein
LIMTSLPNFAAGCPGTCFAVKEIANPKVI